jgi:hypothetical protein
VKTSRFHTYIPAREIELQRIGGSTFHCAIKLHDVLIAINTRREIADLTPLHAVSAEIQETMKTKGFYMRRITSRPN